MASLFGLGHSAAAEEETTTAPAAPPAVWEWQPLGAEVFNVREGPNYKRNKHKAPSAPSLYEAVDVQMVDTPSEPLLRAADGIEFPPCEGLPDRSDDPFPHVPRYVVVAWNLPTGTPPFMASVNTGPGVCVHYVFRITQATWEALRDLDSAPPAVKLWETYCRTALDEEGHQNLNVKGRFKAITQVANLDDTQIPGLMHPYNGKPVLIKKTGELMRANGGEVLEMNVNVHTWPLTTRAGFYSLISHFATALLDSAFVIEGREDEELPETVIGCARVCFPHLDQAGPPRA